MKKAVLILILNFCIQQSYCQYSFSGTSESNVSISTVLGMTMTAGTSYNINFSTASQIASGITVSNMNNFQVKSNMPWYLSVAAATPYFTGTGTYSSNNMPASIISVGVTGQTAVILSTTNQTLLLGNRGSYTATGNTFSTNYTANPGFNYGPGNYSITINYTLTYQ